MSIQALRERHGQLVTEASALNAKADFDPATDGAAFNTMMDEIEKVKAGIRRQEQLNAEAFSNSLVNVVEDDIARRERNNGASPALQAFGKFLRGGKEALNPQDQQALILNTLSSGTGSEGGFTIQTDVAMTMVEALKAFGGMRAVADVLVMDQGNPMSYPTTNGTNEKGERVAENASATKADPTFGTLPLNVQKYSSKIIEVPIELIQDSQIDIVALVTNRMVERLGRITNEDFTIGTGVAMPNGVVTAAATSVTGLTGSTLTVTYDSLIDIQHSVNAAYRQIGNCKFMMNDSALKMIRKIKDLDGRPIFVPGYEMSVPGGAPDMLLGNPITINYEMADPAANAKSILFGDFKYYKIRDVMDVSIRRYNDSVYDTKGQVGFLAWMRSGGNLIDNGGAIKAYAHSAT